MSDTTISPNMNLPVPTVGVDAGPDWANNVNACLNAIDSHNHGAGQGVSITPDGIDINTDLPFNANNAITLRSVNFTAQSAPLAAAGDLGCLYVSGKDLYYNDEDGNAVRITQGGSVTGSTGTITGLPSGTASASFSGTTFSFRSATNTPATMSVGPLVIGAAAASPKTVTLGPNGSQPANYSMLFPLSLPTNPGISGVDSSGQQSFIEPDGITFGINSNNYKVLNNGINTAQIADGAVTNSKLAAAVIDHGNGLSSQTLSSTSFVAVTGLSAGFTSVGRPTILILTSDSAGNNAQVTPSEAGLTLSLQFRRNGSSIAQYAIAIGNSGVNPFWTFVDLAPPAGVNTYTVFAKTSSGSIVIEYLSLVVTEL